MAAQTQIIVSAKDLATSTMRRIGLVSRNLTSELFSMRNALMGGAVAGMAAMVRQSIEATDKIGKVADKVGLTTDQLQELRYAANLAGVAQNQLDMGMQRFSRRLGEVAQGQGELLKTSKQYGVELRNADGSMRSNIDLLGDWSEVIKNAESDQEALRIAFKLFDSEGAALVNMLRGGSAQLLGMRREANELGLVVEERLVRSSEKANDQLTKMEMLIKARLRSTLAELSPDIIDIANGTFEWVRANRELLTQDVPDYVRRTIEQVKSFKGVVSGAADSGLLQTAGLGYIGYKLFGSFGPAKIISALYVIKRGTDELQKIMEIAAEKSGLLMAAPEGYKDTTLGDFMPGGSIDKSYREFMWKILPGVLSGKNDFSGKMTDDYKAALEAAKGQSLPKSLLIASPPSESVDPRNKEYSGARPTPWTEPVTPPTPLSDQQLKLQESLTREIQRLTLDQYAFARAEDERTYQKDLEIAGKSEELIAQAGERRRLSLASIADEEAKANAQKVADATAAQQEISREIERYTLDEYECRRREATRYYDDLKEKATEAGLDTAALDAGLARQIAAINQEQIEASKRAAQAAVEAAKKSRTAWQVYAEDSMDAMQDQADMARTVYGGLESTITNTFTGAKISAMDFFNAVYAEMVKIKIAQPVAGFLTGGIGDIFDGLLGSAQGNVLSGRGISSLSNGIYSSPTFFGFDRHYSRFANGGVLGEAGTEGVFPLARTASGDLGVQAVGGNGGGGNVQVNIHNGTGQAVTTRKSTDNYGNSRLDVMIGDAAAKQLATPGSSLNRAMRSSTGAKQQVVRR
jgi:hypothetical protein